VRAVGGRRISRPVKWIAAAAIALVGVGGALFDRADSAAVADTPVSSSAPGAAVGQLLAGIQVVDRIDDVPGYDRSCAKGRGCTFGPAWNDPSSKSGCDTRNRVLAGQLRDVEFKPGTGDCKVVSGWVTDPYTGDTVQLNDIQIDHIVSLKRAFDSGAYRWSAQMRQLFANDTRNLLAVSGKVNAAKGSDALADWMPPELSARCPHVLRYLTVVNAYHLPITVADRDAALRNCPA